LEYAIRNPTKSFLWTIIRDPTKRAVSQFFHFQVSRSKVEPTDKNFIKWIGEEQSIQNYYLRSLSMKSQDILSPNYDPIAAANQILKDYDFIGVTERMDESAVAVQLLLGLTTGDVLFLNSTSSGGFGELFSCPNKGKQWIRIWLRGLSVCDSRLHIVVFGFLTPYD
jgi:hypothetical protein